MKGKTFLLMLILVSLVTSLILSSFASAHPDGLERVAIDQGFEGTAVSMWSGFMPDYTLAIFGNDLWATGFAGLIGTLLVFGVIYGLMFALVRVKK